MKKAYKVMLTFFQIQNSLKFYHWKTTSYARHKALDKYMKKFLKRMDEFIETYQGKYGRITFEKEEKKDVVVYQIEPKDLDRYLNCVIGFLNGEKDKDCKKYKISNKENYCDVSILEIIDKNDYDMLNIRDEILGLTNQLKYLITLT